MWGMSDTGRLFIFCRTCQTFGGTAGGLVSLAGHDHTGHKGIVVSVETDSELDVAQLFVGWLRIQEAYVND